MSPLAETRQRQSPRAELPQLPRLWDADASDAMQETVVSAAWHGAVGPSEMHRMLSEFGLWAVLATLHAS